MHTSAFGRPNRIYTAASGKFILNFISVFSTCLVHVYLTAAAAAVMLVLFGEAKFLVSLTKKSCGKNKPKREGARREVLHTIVTSSGLTDINLLINVYRGDREVT